MEKEFVVQGYITLPVSMKLKAEDMQTAIEKLYSMVNSENIDLHSLVLKTFGGQVHTVDVHDVEVEWDQINSDEEN
ncbi:hypothetical protein COE51_01340 [Bacillus pseudomycoides]|nr:hypothetical protein COE51_01340 [Bacillus pseudomycoides]